MKDRGGLLAGADPDELALALLAAVQGGILLSQVRRDITPFVAVMNTVIDRIRLLMVSASDDR
ncbi:hypothetical protein ACFVGN_22550 [Streptomyces sp. NPDC057757]|uniref:hypothetical protein n=1 Tax=Streptomyces sp. NPDC057757 TaxID=3346241 RepID=UPI0036BAEE10